MVATQSKFDRLTLEDMDLSAGKKARLHRLFYQHGPGNGTAVILPCDQGLEHGPIDFFENPEAQDPNFIFELALRGNYSAVALQYGLASKFLKNYAGRVPLVLKVNGKTNVPNDDEAFSPLTSGVEDAVRLGADAIGYTLYVGSPAQDMDIAQFNEIRQEADRYGMPIIVWAYPRGKAIKAKGGQDSPYAIEYAARVAQELGADVVKVNYPKVNDPKIADSPSPYSELQQTFEQGVRRIVRAAGNTLVIFSGGSKSSDQDVLDRTRVALESGAHGLIFGRNMWQRQMDPALDLTRRVMDEMRRF